MKDIITINGILHHVSRLPKAKTIKSPAKEVQKTDKGEPEKKDKSESGKKH